jgi:hypothetical protein
MGGLKKLHIEKLRYRRNELQFAGCEFLVAMLMEVKGILGRDTVQIVV